MSVLYGWGVAGPTNGSSKEDLIGLKKIEIFQTYSNFEVRKKFAESAEKVAKVNQTGKFEKVEVGIRCCKAINNLSKAFDSMDHFFISGFKIEFQNFNSFFSPPPMVTKSF